MFLEVGSIFLSITMLVFFAYRGFSVLILAPLIAVFTVLISSGEALLAHYTQVFMVNLGDFATVYFPLFLLSAIFGKVMEVSGSAKSIANYASDKIGAENAILAVVLSCSVLTYGGVSLFVVAFTVYPIAVVLFRKSETPKRLIPAAVALGSFAYTMVSIPGSPAIPNIIPTQYFGTNTFAAPLLGTLSAIFLFAFGMWWLKRQYKIAKANKEGYGDHKDNITVINDDNLPNITMSIIPVFIVIVLNYICVSFVLPNVDTSYLANEKYGAVDIKTVASNWSIIISVFFATAFLLITNYKKLNILNCLNTGATDSLVPIFNTASVVGYGAVINSLDGFKYIKDWILNISSGDPVISSSIVTSVLSGITGSASGGISISLQMMGAKYLEMANKLGIDVEVLHRITTISSSCLDATPHNGAIITLLAICGLTHREAYKDIFVSVFICCFLGTVLSVLFYLLAY